VTTPETAQGNEHIYHQYTIRIGRRDDLKDHLKTRGIGSAVYYPKALHVQPCFASLGYREGQLPEAERACSEVLSLPVYPELAVEQQGIVIDAVREFFT
jgi:dTDP-4-amino-4,6-dideoxygalactose transaminase